MPFTWSEVDDYLAERVLTPDAGLDAAAAATTAAGLPEIAVSPLQAAFLQVLVRAVAARRVLELGTLGGYSTIAIARALPADGRLTSIEFSPEHAAVARASIAAAGVADRVQVRVGAALDVLPVLATETGDRAFDLVFVDADKPNNPHYLAWAVRLLRQGGVVVVDNVVRAGRVAGAADDDPRVHGVRAMFDAVHGDRRLTASVLQTVGAKGHDGFLVATVDHTAA